MPKNISYTFCKSLSISFDFFISSNVNINSLNRRLLLLDLYQMRRTFASLMISSGEDIIMGIFNVRS